MNASIGLLGIGLIGSVIAERLRAAGFRVVGYDPVVPKHDDVEMVANARAVFEVCETVVLSLPDGKAVRSVMDEVESVLDERHLIINTTTGDAEWVHPRVIEATIGGSSVMLRDGKASLFLGGEATLIARAKPVLSALGSRRFHLGDVGAGTRFKLVHNMAIGLNRVVVAETLQFAEALGFDPKQTLEILVQSPASSVAMKAKGPKMAASDYDPPQARLTQHLKDVRLMLAAAREASVGIPLTQVHEGLLEKAEALGFGEADNAAVIESYRKGNRCLG